MFRTTTAALLSILSVASIPAFAAEPQALTPVAASLTSLAAVAPATTSLAPMAGEADSSMPPIQIRAVRGAGRGAVLPALYLSFAALQAFDGYATTAGVRAGAREMNPVMGGAAGNPAAVWAIKGGVTAASIYAADRLWKQHRRGQAIAVMVLSNGIMAVVAARNASVLRAQR